MVRDREGPVPVWGGRPSGEAFSDLLRRRAEALGLGLEVWVEERLDAGSYWVGAAWGDGPDKDVFCEVVDWVDGVRLLDAEAENVTVEQALAYVAARATGSAYRDALEAAGARKAPWSRRLSRWLRRS